MIHVVAILTAAPGAFDTVLQRYRAVLPAVHAEAGCIEYRIAVDHPKAGPFRAAFGPESLVVIEKWDDMASLDAHSRTAHMQALNAVVKPLLTRREVHVLRDV